MGASTGLLMLLFLGVLTVTTGLPVWTLLIGVSSVFAMAGVASGVMDSHVLEIMPARIIGLLESDLLQALPLYVFVGMLLHRLTAADALFSALTRVFHPLGAGQSLAALGVGTLVAPMNGSVASSAFLLTRLVTPRLKGMDLGRATALVSVAATIGVVIPPSLVLILLGDAMMRAHTEASNLPGFVMGQQHIINTQDVFNAALLPGLTILLLWALVARWQSRRVQSVPEPVSGTSYAIATAAGGTIVLLLTGVFTGKLLAVEAAATAGLLLVTAALLTRALTWSVWQEVLEQTLVLTGALMAMLIGATIFSLVFRLWGSDRWLAEQFLNPNWQPMPRALAVLAMVVACAWVLDAFEMIFVVIPILAPPLITILGDAQQAAVLLLLVLQVSFLIPPMGYAVMMARIKAPQKVSLRRLLPAMVPFVLVQLAVVGAVLALPQLVHLLDKPASLTPQTTESETDLDAQMRAMSE
ncbi:MAG TPA: TRAP transporter large permease subunit, partial [Rhodoferax sp.]